MDSKSLFIEHRPGNNNNLTIENKSKKVACFKKVKRLKFGETYGQSEIVGFN